MDKAIQILSAGILIGTTICLVLTYMIAQHLIRETMRLEKEVDWLKRQREESERVRKDLEQSAKKAEEAIKQAFEEWKRKKSLTVVDKDRLDFPPTHKED